MKITEEDNKILDQFRGKLSTTEKQIELAVRKLKYYQDSSDAEIEKAVERIDEKLKIINSEYMQWFEILLAFVFAVVRLYGSDWNIDIPSKDEAIRNGRRSNAIPNNYIDAYEN